MAQQQFHQPRRQGRGDEPEIESPYVPRVPNAHSSSVSSDAQDTLGNIDDALAANEAAVRPQGATGKPLGLEGAEKKADKGPGGALGAAGAGDAAGKALDTVGKGFAPEAAAALKGAQKLKAALWGGKKQKRRTLISGGVVGSVVGIVVLLGALLLPNTVVSIMSDLENRAFAVLDHELEKELQNEMQHFLKNQVFSAVGDNVCGPTKNPVKFAKCLKKIRQNQQNKNDKTAAEDPVEGKGGLVDAWVNSDLAGQFAEKGITFSQDGGKYFVNSNDLSGGKVDVTDFVKGEGDLFDIIGKNSPEFAQTFKQTIDALVVIKGAFLHNIFTRLLAFFYGIHWCIMDCSPGNEQQDRAQDKPADEQEFLEAQEYKDVIEPTASVEGQAIQDVMSGEDPHGRETGTESAAGDISAGDTTKLDKESSQAINQVASVLGSEKLGALVKSFNDLKATGTQYMTAAVAKALSALPGVDIGADTIAKVLGGLVKVINVAGWVQLALQFLHVLLNANTIIPAEYYKIHAVAWVGYFALFATTADEQKSGQDHPQISELGSIAKGFSASDKNGNPSSAMQSPMLQKLIDPNNSKYSNSQVHSYLENGHFALDGGSHGAVAKISQDLNNAFPGLKWIVSILNTVANYALWLITQAFNAAFSVLGVNDLIAKVATPLMGFISEKLFAMPDLMHMSGEDRGTAVAMGADISGNQAVRNVGGEVNGQAATNQVGEQLNEDEQQFEQRPLFARMFATDTPYSFVSRLSLDMPLNFSTAVQSSFADLIENPLGKLFGSFASVLHPANAFAASADTANVDVGGVAQYAIPDTDAVFSQDPATYWKAHDCEQQSKQDYPNWNKAVVYNPNTGQYDHTTTNGCLLIQRSSEAGATLFGGVQDGSESAQ